MFVEPYYHKNIDPLGDWDGTWDETFVYYIFGEDGYQVRRSGFRTEEEAREAGERALKRLEDKR